MPKFKKGFQKGNKGFRNKESYRIGALKGAIKKRGIRMPDSRKKKISEALRGKKNPNWQGGITPINESIRKSAQYKLWRRAVYERDGYRCVFCGVIGTGNNLHADHIKPFALFPELRFAIDNGRTLCVDCHKKTDTYGWKTYHAKRT